MDISVKFNLNPKLFISNPEDSAIGRKIIEHSILMIHKIGLEAFTFRKLAVEINSTEATIYRYFENKHRLLLYIVDWYWSWVEYRIVFKLNNVKNPELKLKKAIDLLCEPVEEDTTFKHINEKILHEIIMSEGAKTYLTKHVDSDNKAKFFKPYKDLCARIASYISEFNPKYEYPNSLATSIIEIAYSQNYYSRHLPSLTNLVDTKSGNRLADFIENLVFSSIER